MQPSDLDQVVGIEELSFSHPWTRDQLNAEFTRGSCSISHVAIWKSIGDLLKSGAIAGYIMAWLVVDELYITNLAVAPAVRRAGVAAALLDHTIAEAVNMGTTWCQLEVRAQNVPARELYGRFGFEILGFRKGYYQGGEDAVVMGKDLVSSA
jgi:ribosomal-protein-alanine N-acetyltransferase